MKISRHQLSVIIKLLPPEPKCCNTHKVPVFPEICGVQLENTSMPIKQMQVLTFEWDHKIKDWVLNIN